MKLSVVIPAYNEERTISQVLDAVCRVELRGLDGRPMDREILVIDDGSTDRTLDILGTYASCPHVRVLAHDRNRGK